MQLNRRMKRGIEPPFWIGYFGDAHLLEDTSEQIHGLDLRLVVGMSA